MSVQVGDLVAGRYRLLESIGDGAMGAVYRAEHVLMNKVVAVKILHADVSDNSEIVERFRREAQAAASIEHANICTVTDFDTTDSGDFFLVMEMLEGETLQARIERQGKLSALTSIYIMQQLLSVLECAHRKGIVHRDVKPENVFLIHRDGSDDFVKLLDFGIARSKHLSDKGAEALTQAGMIYGTPQYISPEQACGKTIDYRADLYACGVILYEMLEGERPFNSDNLIKLLHMHSFDMPPALNADVVEEHQAFDEIIQRLMMKNPDDRYQSAGDVMLALDDILVRLFPNAPDASLRMTIAGVKLATLSPATAGIATLDPKTKAGKTPTIKKLIADEFFALLPKFNAKTWRYLSLIVGAIVLLAILTSVLIAKRSVTKESSSIEPETQTVIYSTKTERKPLLTKLSKKEITPQSFNYEEKYKISYDAVLSQDRNIVSAVENMFTDNAESSLASLEAVYDKYKDHPNYLRLMLLVHFDLKEREEGLRYLKELLEIVPDATRNPHVQKLVFYSLTRSALKQKTLDILAENKSLSAAFGITELLIELPSDSKNYSSNKKALFEIYESLPHTLLPLWRQKTIEATMLSQNECEKRLEIFKTLEDDMNPEFFSRIVMPMYNDCYRKRKGKWYQRKSKSCQNCMKSWLRKVYDKEKEKAQEDKKAEEDKKDKVDE